MRLETLNQAQDYLIKLKKWIRTKPPYVEKNFNNIFMTLLEYKVDGTFVEVDERKNVVQYCLWFKVKNKSYYLTFGENGKDIVIKKNKKSEVIKSFGKDDQKIDSVIDFFEGLKRKR